MISVPHSEHFQFPFTGSRGVKSLLGESPKFLNAIFILICQKKRPFDFKSLYPLKFLYLKLSY